MCTEKRGKKRNDIDPLGGDGEGGIGKEKTKAGDYNLFIAAGPS